jgi:hypothetical protein
MSPPTPEQQEKMRLQLSAHLRKQADEERKTLTALWRKMYPDLISRPSYEHTLLKAGFKVGDEPPGSPDESWANDIYLVRLFKESNIFGLPATAVEIITLNGQPRHCRRDVAYILAQLALGGPSVEYFAPTMPDSTILIYVLPEIKEEPKSESD